jgi:ElaB/YqjD/DUF883 family membrane-anchored ribosome-binding protein
MMLPDLKRDAVDKVPKLPFVQGLLLLARNYFGCLLFPCHQISSTGGMSMFDPTSRHNSNGPNANQPDAKPVAEAYDALRADISTLSESVRSYAGDHLGKAATDAQHEAQKQLSSMEAAVRKNPIQSALIAAGIGLVVGLLVTR